MKKTYSKPIVEIEKFNMYDVIATSGIEGGDGGYADWIDPEDAFAK